jgi:hypothetical protein
MHSTRTNANRQKLPLPPLASHSPAGVERQGHSKPENSSDAIAIGFLLGFDPIGVGTSICTFDPICTFKWHVGDLLCPFSLDKIDWWL